ncbi:hypothetical protein AB0C38_05605 [Amycolatopsis sp. NPDC048633]|uniref:hypothetical protein n=1 Tax=Amycolatopsis sp. NPDC048633 TaxID=3157095 RepID=UPI0033CA2460
MSSSRQHRDDGTQHDPHRIVVANAHRIYARNMLSDADNAVSRLQSEEATLLGRRTFCYRVQASAIGLMFVGGAAGAVLLMTGLLPLALIGGGFSLLNGGCVAGARSLDKQLRGDLKEVRLSLERERKLRRETWENLANNDRLLDAETQLVLARSEEAATGRPKELESGRQKKRRKLR